MGCIISMNELQGFHNDAFSKANKKPVSFDKIKIKTKTYLNLNIYLWDSASTFEFESGLKIGLNNECKSKHSG